MSHLAQNSATVGHLRNFDFTSGVSSQALSPSNAWPIANGRGSILTNNEVIAILMDFTTYPGSTPTINTNQSDNPQQTKFLNAKISG